MQNRDELLVSIRPEVVTQPAIATELFQNQTLRPILKLQHPILLVLFRDQCQKQADAIYLMDEPAKQSWIENILMLNVPLRNEILGLVIGHFTEGEMSAYLAQKAEIRKRILKLAAQRILSVI
jgi:hypothetical protein